MLSYLIHKWPIRNNTRKWKMSNENKPLDFDDRIELFKNLEENWIKRVQWIVMEENQQFESRCGINALYF